MHHCTVVCEESDSYPVRGRACSPRRLVVCPACVQWAAEGSGPVPVAATACGVHALSCEDRPYGMRLHSQGTLHRDLTEGRGRHSRRALCSVVCKPELIHDRRRKRGGRFTRHLDSIPGRKAVSETVFSITQRFLVGKVGLLYPLDSAVCKDCRVCASPFLHPFRLCAAGPACMCVPFPREAHEETTNAA